MHIACLLNPRSKIAYDLPSSLELAISLPNTERGDEMLYRLALSYHSESGAYVVRVTSRL